MNATVLLIVGNYLIAFEDFVDIYPNFKSFFQGDSKDPFESVPTSLSQKPATPSMQSSTVQREGAKIPIYRRGYGVNRAGAVNPRPLIWEDGRLRQIEAEPSILTESQPSAKPFPGAVVGRGMFPPAAPSSAQRLSLLRSEDMSLKARGRFGRSRGKGRGSISSSMSPAVSATSSRPSRVTREDGSTGLFKVPEMDTVSFSTSTHRRLKH